MRTLKLTIAYDGGDFCGWQLQDGQPTVQGAVEDALRRVTGETIRIAGSGRTDAGVHAIGQVASCEIQSDAIPTANLARALNAVLPDTVVVKEVVEAPLGFDATRHAVRKRYRYVVLNSRERDVFLRRFAWRVRPPLDIEAMRRASRCLIGEHDFRSFEGSASRREQTVRIIYDLSIERDPAAPERIIMEVEGNGFLYNMVRAIVGSLVEVGRGQQREEWLREALEARDRRAAGPTAPPQGLFLLRVMYDT